MASTTLIVSAVSIISLYNTAFAQHRLHLTEMVSRQARLINNLVRYEDASGQQNQLDKDRFSILLQVTDTLKQFDSFGQTGVFTLARKLGSKMEFVVSPHGSESITPDSIPFAGHWAEPMRRALSGESGSLIGLDYRGVSVLAAYEPVGILRLGIVAKIDLAEIRAPFIRVGLIAMTVALAVILFSIIFFARVSQPITRKIEQQSETFRTLVETVHEGIIMIDAGGIIQFVNPAAEAMFGYAQGELVGSNVNRLMPSPHREEHDRYIEDYLQSGVGKIIGIGRQLAALRKNGSHFPMYLSVGDIDLGHTRLFTGVILDLSEQQQLQREIMDIPTREQRRIGQELHDGVGQQLTGLGMLATSLLNKATRTDHDLADQLATGLKQALSDLRALSRGLMPVEVTVENFSVTLRNLGLEVERMSGTRVETLLPETVPLLNDNAAMQLYRVAQEALNNAVKHANASLISVSLKLEPRFGLLEVSDNGEGLARNPSQSSGLGLRIMRHRCSLFDGEFSIAPGPQTGTRVSCRFPVITHREIA